jgi:hypothetical protein
MSSSSLTVVFLLLLQMTDSQSDEQKQGSQV